MHPGYQLTPTSLGTTQHLINFNIPAFIAFYGMPLIMEQNAEQISQSIYQGIVCSQAVLCYHLGAVMWLTLKTTCLDSVWIFLRTV